MSHKKSSVAAVDIVTVEPDGKGFHVISATDKKLSVSLAGHHFDDAAQAQTEIFTQTGHKVCLRVAQHRTPA